MERSFLKQMSLPGELWAEAVRHSVHILNKLPTRALTGKTPYEVWTGNKPSVEFVQVFGCVAHMKVPGQQTKKLDDRSVMVVNLGKEPGTKAFRLYDPRSGKVYVSRDVTFEERKKWPWDDLEESQTQQDSAHSFDVPEPKLDEGGEQSRGRDNEEQEINTPQRKEIPDPSTYDDSGVPKRFRSLADVYNESEEVEIEDELLCMGVDEPSSYKTAVKEKAWRQAMQNELDSIEKNETWKLTQLPPGQKVIGLKWIYKLKRDAEGKIVKHMARLVAKGYVQEKVIDFEELFAPVTRLETVRLLLALAAKNSCEVHHLDVKTAFLNGEISEEVYVSQPEGFEKQGKEHLVYKLFKALYGLRQAPRAWYSKLNSYLEEIGFKRCPYEHGVYTKRDGNKILIVGIYVDDILETGTDLSVIQSFKNQMNAKFGMSDMGLLSYYLGIDVRQNNGCIELRQTGYAKKVLERAGLADCNPTKFPMDPKEIITKDESGKGVNSTEFKSLVGGLRYLVHTRPDIAYSVGIVSRYMERPTVLHLNAVKRILRYIKGTLEFGLVYSKDGGNNMLSGYSDSDHAGNTDDRKSTGGMAFYLNESLVTWVSQKQRCVALSSCFEASDR